LFWDVSEGAWWLVSGFMWGGESVLFVVGEIVRGSIHLQRDGVPADDNGIFYDCFDHGAVTPRLSRDTIEIL
jgi:hypothetical protein